MRAHGTLTKWNDDRGFGFITPAAHGDEIFVHISAFPKHAGRPQINELLSYETEVGPEGKMRAVRIMRPGQDAARTRSRSNERREHGAGFRASALMMLAVIVIGVAAYKHFGIATPVLTNSSPTTNSRIAAPAATFAPASPAATLSSPTTSFRCDGRTRCGQMTSCAEAKYFLQHCPGTEMDGDGDGVPCEQQWCAWP